MSEQQTQYQSLFSALAFVFILLFIDIFTLFLQPHDKAISHLSFAVLVAQLLLVLVCIKGDICPGQRGRIIKVGRYLLIYWAIWLLLSLFSNYHYVLTDIISVAGIAVTLAISLQPQETQMQKSILILGGIMGILGGVCYFLLFVDLPILFFSQYNFITQIMIGLVLTNLILLLAKNRLHGFIALVSRWIIISLLINALAMLGVLYYAHLHHIILANEMAVLVYFLSHLAIVFIMGLHIFTKTSLNILTSFMLLLFSSTLPIWISFAYFIR